MMADSNKLVILFKLFTLQIYIVYFYLKDKINTFIFRDRIETKFDTTTPFRLL